MITQLKIENYKSIQNLTLDVGRVNVLIGENGCGKSNILEAITLAAAADANKLDDEFLFSRGIRVTKSQLMRSAFDCSFSNQNIKITIDAMVYTLFHNNKTYSKWIDLEWMERIGNKLNISKQYRNEVTIVRKFFEQLKPNDSEIEFEKLIPYCKLFAEQKLEKTKKIFEFDNFVIYAPENTTLRNLEREGQIQPLGINGEGLFKLLTETQKDAEQSQEFSELNDIQETLGLFGWFDSITIPNNHSQLEQKLTIQDRYLETPFDQRSANEGFLLVLFYITLVVSKYTPKIFAIDNIDTSLNPKLCTKLIKELTRLAKKYDKQIFLTSHNPAILDGIDLSDDEQRLFVVSRNKQGHTRCKRIELKDSPKSSIRDRLSRVFTEEKLYSREEILNAFDNSDEPLNLSYALLRGYLGGLPKNF